MSSFVLPLLWFFEICVQVRLGAWIISRINVQLGRFVRWFWYSGIFSVTVELSLFLCDRESRITSIKGIRIVAADFICVPQTIQPYIVIMGWKRLTPPVE